MYKSIAVIGVGTLGGFVANSVSNIETVETLIIIDHDLVEHKNLKNSIYRQIDVGESKTEALSDIIKGKNNDITVITINEKFIEGKTTIPKCDLVLDCRDYTYDRRKEVDARLYISSRYLMVDCRNNVEYKVKTEGKYLVELKKEDLRYAASVVSMLIFNNTIETLTRDKCVQKYELDYTKRVDDHTCDIVYENPYDDGNFVNLPEKIVPILEANKQAPIEVFIGSSLLPICEFLIPQNSLQTSTDIVTSLSREIQRTCEFKNFVVSLHQRVDGRCFIELIPETGAA